MKAILHTRYGPPDELQLTEVEKPTPKENQVLIRVHAASVNAGDYRVLRGSPFLLRAMIGGLLKPKDPHKALPPTAIPLRFIAAGKPGRQAESLTGATDTSQTRRKS